MKETRLKNKKVNPVFLLIAIFLNIIIAVTLWQILQVGMELRNFRNFTDEVQEETHNFTNTIEYYSDILYSLRGIFSIHDEDLSLHEWSYFNDSLKFQERYPGITGLAYVKKVNKVDVRDYIDQLQKEYSIVETPVNNIELYPEVEKDNFYIVSRVSPIEEYYTALGYDVSSEEKRWEAMVRARDSGLPAATEKIQLVDVNKSTGILIFLPVYNIDSDIDTIEHRQSNLKGFVLAVFELPEVIDEIFLTKSIKKNIELEIYDITNNNPIKIEDSVYLSSLKLVHQDGKYKNVSVMNMGGRVWELQFKTDAQYKVIEHDKLFVTILPLMMFITNLILSMFAYSQLGSNNNRQETSD